MIPYGRQDISQADIDAVVDVLKSDFLTQGEMVPCFEKAVCDYSGASYGVAANSGTSALHIACKSLGLGEGDWLWTTPVTFVASANCGLYCGAQVDFVDIDPVSWNISVECLAVKLDEAEKANRLPKIVVAVHLCGLSCDMQAIHELGQKYGFRIIEDASHAIGGRYQGNPIGDCCYSDITIFSFHPVKTITSGEGGIAVTNQKHLAEKMDMLRSHGITRNPTLMAKETEGDWYYQQIDLGYNYRMTDIHAALGASQLTRLDDFVEKRHKLAKKYDEALHDLPLQLPIYKSYENFSGLHLYSVRLKQHDRKETFDSLRQMGIGVNVHYIPVHTQPYYESLGFKQGDFPEAEKYYSEAISLPMFPSLHPREQNKVILSLKSLFS